VIAKIVSIDRKRLSRYIDTFASIYYADVFLTFEQI